MDEQLMKYLGFDESDLQANRNGRLSEKQKARLQKEENSQKGCSAFLGVFLFAVALIGVAIAVILAPVIASEDQGAAIALGVAFGGIWPMVWGGIGFFSIRRAFAKMDVKVKKAKGPINIVNVIREEYDPSTQSQSELSVHELHVGGRAFDVESNLADAMRQGDVYAVYYAKFDLEDKEDEILSAEFLEKTK